MPSRPPSRPRPDCLTPPNGAAALETRPLVEADHAGLEALDHAQAARQVAGEDVGDEAVLGVRWRRRPPRPRRRTSRSARPARRSPRRRLRVAGHVARARSARRSSRGPSSAVPPASAARAAPRPRRRRARATLSRCVVVDERADLRRRPRCRGPTFSAPIRSASVAANSSATDSCTMKRLAAVHASPMLRILATIAPSTAASRSASSKTTNGALPPSSIEVRSTFSAACASSVRPTSVEPVNDSLRRRGSAMIGAGTSRPAESSVTTLTTPRGQAGVGEQLREEQRRQRRQLRRLDDHRAAGGERRRDLARRPSRAGSSTA